MKSPIRNLLVLTNQSFSGNLIYFASKTTLQKKIVTDEEELDGIDTDSTEILK